MSPELTTRINHITTLQGWCTVDKAQYLADLVVTHNIQAATESGIFGGRSIIAIAMAMQFKGSGFVYGFDPWSQSSALEGTNAEANNEWWKQCDLESVYRGFIEAVLRFNLTKECRWIRMKSEEVACLFPDHSLDLVHVDGNHSEELSTRDVNLWYPKVKPGGHIVCDDTDWSSVQCAYKMLLDRGKLIHSTNTWACVQV